MLSALKVKFQSKYNQEEVKQTFFNKKWGSSSALAKQVSREDYTFDETVSASPRKMLNKEILMPTANKYGDEVTEFIDQLSQASICYLAARHGLQVQELQEEATRHESMVGLINEMMHLLQGLSHSLNAAVGFSDLRTSYTEPTYVTEVTRFSTTRNPLESITYYRARLSSSQMTLVVRGRSNAIEWFLLPPGQVMGLSKTEKSYEPIMRLEGVNDQEDGFVWYHQGRPQSERDLQRLCLELFAQLINQTRITLES